MIKETLEGYAARMLGGPKEDNPYYNDKFNYKEYNAWNIGWNVANEAIHESTLRIIQRLDLN